MAVNIPDEARGRRDPNPWFEAHAVLIAKIEVWTSGDDSHSDFLLSILSASLATESLLHAWHFIDSWRAPWHQQEKAQKQQLQTQVNMMRKHL